VSKKIDADELVDANEIARVLGLAHRNSVTTFLNRCTVTAPNVAFCRSMGFEVIGGWDTPGGGPHGWTMHRPARRP